jgi:hypothetical protein
MLKKIQFKNKKVLFYGLLILFLTIFIINLILIINYNKSKKEEAKVILTEGQEDPGDDDTRTRPLEQGDDMFELDVESMLRGVRLREEMEEQYPWYSELPIVRDEYVVVWIWEREQFRIDLKIPRDTIASIRDGLIRRALRDIENLTKGEVKQSDYYVVFN